MQKTPKYVEIIDFYKNEIETGTIQNNEAFPPESSICKQFSCSHMTVTKAMNELAISGYIKRIPGKGTFATNQFTKTIKKPIIKSNSLSVQIYESGMAPRTELKKYTVVRGKDIPEVAKILNINENEYLHYFVRLRYGDDNLVCISYTYVSQNIMPTIDITRLEGSFNEYVNELGIHRSYGSTEFKAVLPSKSQSEIIGSNHVPLLKQTIIWNVNDLPFELTYHYFVGDKYTVTQDLRIKYNEDGTMTKELLHEGYHD